MANLKSLVKDTAIYGLSSIVGRFLNYLLVPLYTHCMPHDSGDYGVSTNIYAYVALILVILTFGMETTLFRFANQPKENPDSVFTMGFTVVGTLTALFLGLVLGFLPPISDALGYANHPEYVWMMAVVVALDALQALPFSWLRYKKRPVKFASLKLLFIAFNIALNCIFFLGLGKTQVFYVFAINLACTGLITLFFVGDLFKIKWQWDWDLLRRMLGYSWPLLVLGIAGILNQAADKMLFPMVYPDRAEAEVQLGIYGACVKIAMVMAMITQAFRYAYEPIVFAKMQDNDKNEYYAAAMKYFIIFTLLAFLCVVGWMPLLQHIIGEGYRDGLRVVPIVMAAEMMMGVYFNLSFWYKLIDKTIYGAWFSLAGCAVLFAVNIWGIPRYGYMACAWGGFAGYGTAMTLSYLVGQRKYPIAYPMRSILTYTAITVFFYIIMKTLPESWSPGTHLGINTLLILAFVGHIIHHDLPLRMLPVIGKYFRK
ncbi:MAG: lipopolysaccharide biosynthesis protein [Bacteroidaceae bacterium]|nr:lipopolysaccharide biosynthesis protein [Bacteroidaceae bacterium]MDE6158834.1 lipopolysaccharide biosynthesis protein [Bacteroidaceae bacterium]